MISVHKLILCDFKVERSTPVSYRQIVSRQLKAIKIDLFARSVTQLSIMRRFNIAN